MNFLDLIFPRKCLECGENGIYICRKCLSHVEKSNKAFSIWKYQGVIRKAVIKLKYNFSFDISSELSSHVLRELKSSSFRSTKYILLPIPLHKSRENWRGFNQASILGKAISTGMLWQFEENLLTRKLASKQQARLKKEDRLRNISGKFAVKEDIDLEFYKNKRILLFDDVFTTGATIKEAEKTLREFGIGNISWLTLCG